MIVFGAVLEGAPALIIFGPLLTPIAQQLGVNPLHFGTVMVIAMGLGLFSPPVGLGLFATCAITGTRVQDVARPMAKYLVLLVADGAGARAGLFALAAEAARPVARDFEPRVTTIQDVARHAGVSVSTVSNVLNGRTDRMRPETLAARRGGDRRRCGFRPNRRRSSSRPARRRCSACWCPRMANPMYGYIAREIETVRAGALRLPRLLLGNTYRDTAKESALLRRPAGARRARRDRDLVAGRRAPFRVGRASAAWWW